MPSDITHGFTLTSFQKHRIIKALSAETGVHICIKNERLIGEDLLLIHKIHLRAILKRVKKGLGYRMKLSHHLLIQNRDKGYLSFLTVIPPVCPKLVDVGQSVWKDLLHTQKDVNPGTRSLARKLASMSGVEKILSSEHDMKLIKRDFVGLRLVPKMITNEEFRDLVNSIKIFQSEFNLLEDNECKIEFFESPSQDLINFIDV